MVEYEAGGGGDKKTYNFERKYFIPGGYPHTLDIYRCVHVAFNDGFLKKFAPIMGAL